MMAVLHEVAIPHLHQADRRWWLGSGVEIEKPTSPHESRIRYNDTSAISAQEPFATSLKKICRSSPRWSGSGAPGGWLWEPAVLRVCFGIYRSRLTLLRPDARQKRRDGGVLRLVKWIG